MAETKNIFIVHAHADDELVVKLKDLIGRAGMTIRDGSIDGQKPNDANNEEYIKRQYLRPHIDWASTVVVLITHETAQSEWVNWEIKYAAQREKTIVGVFAQGATDADLPEELRNCPGVPLVGWQGQRVVDAILGKVAPRDEADGEGAAESASSASQS